MRRILIVGGLVVLLAAAIIVPALAAEQSGDTNPFAEILRPFVNAGLISAPDGLNTADNPSSSPDVGSSGVGSSSVGTSLDPNSVVSSSGSDSSSTSTTIRSSSDPDDPTPVSQEFSERRIASGKASPSSSFSNSGDNVNACPTTQQVVNTGNVANQQGVSQYNTTTDDIDLSGSSITIDSSATATCDQTLNQAAAAGKYELSSKKKLEGKEGVGA